MYIGLQGSSAMFFCRFCIATKKDILQNNFSCATRSLEQLKFDFERLQQMLVQAKGDKAIAKAHQQCNSVKHRPMTDYIDVCNISPPPMHCIAGSLCAILEFAQSCNKDK